MISRGGDSENFGTVLKFSRYVSPFHDMYSITVLPCIRIEQLAWRRGLNQERHARAFCFALFTKKVLFVCLKCFLCNA
jgi:hypothetical protein